MMNITRAAYPVIFSFFIGANTLAGNHGDSGLVAINRIGCNLGTDTCYIIINKEVGPFSCKSDSIRWQKNLGNGKQAFSLLAGAFYSGKKVSLMISTDCFVVDSLYPTFNFFNIQNS